MGRLLVSHGVVHLADEPDHVPAGPVHRPAPAAERIATTAWPPLGNCRGRLRRQRPALLRSDRMVRIRTGISRDEFDRLAVLHFPLLEPLIRLRRLAPAWPS